MAKSKYTCHYEDSFSDKGWLIREKGWDPKQQSVRETQFTLGNGAMCMRGVLEEIPYDSYPGTYIGGLFDRTGAQITELVNLPNPLQFRVDVYGEKLDPIAMDVVHHKRILDIKRGTLFRHTIYKTTHKKRLDYSSRRFVSLHDKNLVVMEVVLTPLDADMTINMQTTVDSGVTNRGTATEGRKRHFQACDISSGKDYTYRCVETFEKKTLVAYASALEISTSRRSKLVGDRAVNLRVKKNQTIKFRKYIAIKSSTTSSTPKIRRETMKHLKAARRRGFEKLILEHEKAWQDRWDISDVEIDGDNEAVRALRFNMYHLIISGNEDDDDVSIGAKTLSGEGYRGHVFWDTELFILPFFIYTNPAVARNILMYRYHRLEAARNNAYSKGFEGALFPWESADTGEECTPSWAKDFDGKIIKIVTMDEEHHIVSDIAYAFAHYCRATGHDHFLWRYAIEVLIETARFWATRVIHNAKSGKYEIHGVMGPDEFHENVNNNAYTNLLAKWNLRKAYEWVNRFRRTSPTRFSALSKRLKIKKGEAAAWKKISDRMLIPTSKKKKLIEQFKGFLKLKDHRITSLNQHFMPEIPTSVDWSEVGKTQFIKQADVVMLLYLLSDKFTHAEKKKNYYYYERRTLHKSSLSPAIHSIVGLEVGDEDKALHYFSHGLSTDLSNIHGNTADGMHAASAGGTWQAAVMGFAGMRPQEKAITFNPHIPSHWKGMRFKIWWRGALLEISINHSKTEIRIKHRPKRGKVFASVYGETKQLKTNVSNCFLHPSTKKKGCRRR